MTRSIAFYCVWAIFPFPLLPISFILLRRLVLIFTTILNHSQSTNERSSNINHTRHNYCYSTWFIIKLLFSQPSVRVISSLLIHNISLIFTTITITAFDVDLENNLLVAIPLSIAIFSICQGRVYYSYNLTVLHDSLARLSDKDKRRTSSRALNVEQLEKEEIIKKNSEAEHNRLIRITKICFLFIILLASSLPVFIILISVVTEDNKYIFVRGLFSSLLAYIILASSTLSWKTFALRRIIINTSKSLTGLSATQRTQRQNLIQQLLGLARAPIVSGILGGLIPLLILVVPLFFDNYQLILPMLFVPFTLSGTKAVLAMPLPTFHRESITTRVEDKSALEKYSQVNHERKVLDNGNGPRFSKDSVQPSNVGRNKSVKKQTSSKNIGLTINPQEETNSNFINKSSQNLLVSVDQPHNQALSIPSPNKPNYVKVSPSHNPLNSPIGLDAGNKASRINPASPFGISFPSPLNSNSTKNNKAFNFSSQAGAVYYHNNNVKALSVIDDEDNNNSKPDNDPNQNGKTLDPKPNVILNINNNNKDLSGSPNRITIHKTKSNDFTNLKQLSMDNNNTNNYPMNGYDDHLRKTITISNNENVNSENPFRTGTISSSALEINLHLLKSNTLSTNLNHLNPPDSSLGQGQDNHIQTDNKNINSSSFVKDENHPKANPNVESSLAGDEKQIQKSISSNNELAMKEMVVTGMKEPATLQKPRGIGLWSSFSDASALVRSNNSNGPAATPPLHSALPNVRLPPLSIDNNPKHNS